MTTRHTPGSADTLCPPRFASVVPLEDAAHSFEGAGPALLHLHAGVRARPRGEVDGGVVRINKASQFPGKPTLVVGRNNPAAICNVMPPDSVDVHAAASKLLDDLFPGGATISRGDQNEAVGRGNSIML